MPVVGLSGPRCSASAATSSANFCFSFTTRSRPLCSYSRWRLSLDVVTWCDATKIGLQHRPNARYPAPCGRGRQEKIISQTQPVLGTGDMEHLVRARGGLVKSSQYVVFGEALLWSLERQFGAALRAQSR